MPINWSSVGEGVASGAAGGASFGPVGAGIGSIIGGGLSLIHSLGEPDYSYLTDPNSAFYRNAQNKYFEQLQRTLNQSTAGTSQLLGASMAKGGDYGGSSYIANKQREGIEAKNRETASSSAQDFVSNMFRQNMGVGAQMQQEATNDINSFNNQLLGLGGGIGAKLLDKSNASVMPGQQPDYSPIAKYMNDEFKPGGNNPATNMWWGM